MNTKLIEQLWKNFPNQPVRIAELLRILYCKEPRK